MGWTTADDVIAAWIGSDAPTNTDTIALWIEKAEREVRFRVPGVQARIDADEPDLLEAVIDVVTSMVHRKFRNPDGIRQYGSTTGPFTEQRTYGGDNPGELALTADELARLVGATGDNPRAFSIDLMPSTSPFSPYYVPAYPWL